MTQEEMLKRARELYECSSISDKLKKELESAFPELKESEDEKIIRTLKEIVNWGCAKNISVENNAELKECLAWIEKQCEKTEPIDGFNTEFERQISHLIASTINKEYDYTKDFVKWTSDALLNYAKHELEKQGRQKSQCKSAFELWKDMRFEAYLQASGNRHEPNYSDDSTKMFSINDIDEIFEKVAEKQGEQENLCDKCRKEQPSHSCQDITALGRCALEKQGEQKPTDKAEPKFKVGDWIVYNRNDSSREILYVYDIRDGRYYFNDNIHFSWSVKECEEKSHFWTIQDAKDGDVLADCFGNICIYQKPSTNTYYHTHCYGNHKYFIDDGGSHEVAGTYPATKEQRDILFQKMREAGYEWDVEKKELKKIEQKTSWSEEDENMWLQIINELEAIKSNSSTIFEKNIAQDKIDWLQSLKEKIHPNKE